MLIRGKTQTEPQQAGLQIELERGKVNSQEANKNFFDIVFEYFTYFESEFDKAQEIVNKEDKDQQFNDKVQEKIKSLHLFSIWQVLQPLIQSKRKQNFTYQEDENYIGHFIQKFRQHQEISDTVLFNLPIFHLFDKFCLLGPQYFDVVYQFSIMLTLPLEYYQAQKDSDVLLKDMQNYIMTYSIQFIWQLYLHMSSKIKEQKQLSCNFISMMLFKNEKCVKLVSRLYPKTIFKQMREFKSFSYEIISKTGEYNTSWEIKDWDHFFNNVTTQEINTALDQWTKEIQGDMMQKLKIEIEIFKDTKRRNFLTLNNKDQKKLELPNHEFDKDYTVKSTLKNIKWSYAEFEIESDGLQNQYKVGKFYLKKLIGLSPDDQMPLDKDKRPKFNLQIESDYSPRFFDELTVRFIASNDQKEHKIILKTICILYSNYYKKIFVLKSLPFWLKLIKQKEYKYCHFILLQLVHVALQINKEKQGKNDCKEIGKQNLRMFIHAGGFQILLEQMNSVFKDLEKQQSQNQQLKRENDQETDSKDLLNTRKQILSRMAETQQQETMDMTNPKHDFLINYTNSTTNSKYFKRNGSNISTGILSLKILDIVFQSMQYSDYMPLPSNRKFIFEKNSLATLTQMFTLQNSDLTREVLIFIETHLDSHYAFFTLKNTGIIELLILCLSTRNGDRALNLLLKFQEVCIGFNEQLKIGLLNKNDLKMIQEDKNKNQKKNDQQKKDQKAQGKREPLLLESIFLRYLPVPFIKFLYEKNSQDFLDVYKSDSYREPILIWEKKHRMHLEEQIQINAKTTIEKIIRFAAKNQEMQDFKGDQGYENQLNKKVTLEFKQPEKIDMISKIIKYEEIEQEVRCGRYYLGVWVYQKKNEFKIPTEEEYEFHNKMQAELRTCIYEEQFRNKKKIIILFKSCYMAQKSFKELRIHSLNEIKRILMHICKPDSQNDGLADKDTCQETNLKEEDYDSETKEIIFIGMKIIHKAIEYQQNRKEILKMNGVEFIADIVGFILKNSFKASLMLIGPSQKAQYQDLHGIDTKDIEEYKKGQQFQKQAQLISLNFVVKNSESNERRENIDQSITVDRIEGKTLYLCIEATTQLVQEDIQAFQDLPLEERVRIFIQMTQILSLSFQLYLNKTCKHRQPKPTKNDELSKSISFSVSKTACQTFGNTSGLKKDILNKKNKKRKPKKNRKAGDKSEVEQNPDINNAKSNNKLKGTKQKDGDYTKPLLQIINNKKDKFDTYALSLILMITKSIFNLAKQIAIYPVLHPELIASGLAWQAIQHCYFDLTEERNSKHSFLPSILNDSLQMLKQLISFASKFSDQGAESFQFKNLIKEKEKNIIEEFHKCIQRFFTIKMQQTLRTEFTVNNENKLEFKETNEKDFFSIFSAENIEEPQIVWNEKTRQEMLDILQLQLQLMTKKSANVIEEVKNNQDNKQVKPPLFSEQINTFDYSYNRTELVVNKIFVKYFNQQLSSDFPATEDFAKKLIIELQKIIKSKTDKKSLKQNQEDSNQKIEEIVKAFKNLVVKLHLNIEGEIFKSHIETLFNLIKIDQKLDKKEKIPQEEKERLKRLSSEVFEIIDYLVRNSDLQEDYQNQLDFGQKLRNHMDQNQIVKKQSMTDVLLANEEFFKLMKRVMYDREIEVVIFNKQIRVIIDGLIKMKNDQVQNIFIKNRLIYLMLNLIFRKEEPSEIEFFDRDIRGRLVDQLLRIEQLAKINNANYKDFLKNFIPTNFFAEIREHMRRNLNNKNSNFDEPPLIDKEMKFLDDFDQPEFENVFVIWNEKLRNESHQKIKDLCKSKTEFLIQEEIKNIDLDYELIINEKKHILRIYNRNPAIFIDKKLNSFITDIAKEIHKISAKLYQLGMRSDAEKIRKQVDENDELAELKKRYKYTCYCAQVLLTSLLLSIEQLHQNSYNPNLTTLRSRDENNQGQMRMNEVMIHIYSQNDTIEGQVYKFLKVWLQSPVFLVDNISQDIRITFLQVLLLIVDIQDNVQWFIVNEVPLQFISDAIDRMSKEGDKPNRFLENSLILLIKYRILKGDVTRGIKLFLQNRLLEDFLKQLKQIREKQSVLKNYVDLILNEIQKYDEQKVKAIFPQLKVIELDKKTIENYEHSKIWREKPKTSNQLPKFYEFKPDPTIEKYIDTKYLQEKTSSNLLKFPILPILSEKSIAKYPRNEMPQHPELDFAINEVNRDEQSITESSFNDLSNTHSQFTHQPNQTHEEESKGH